MNSEGRDLIIHIRSFYRIDAKVETRQGRAIVFVTTAVSPKVVLVRVRSYGPSTVFRNGRISCCIQSSVTGGRIQVRDLVI